MNIVLHLQGLLEEIANEQAELEHMSRAWEQDDEPSCDPGLQFEQGEKIETMLRNFFKETQRLAPRYDGTDLNKFVIQYQDESYEANVPGGSGFPTRLIQEARKFDTLAQAQEHAQTLVDVKAIERGADLIG